MADDTGVADNDQAQSKLSQLTIPLDHAWRWYDLRINAGMQVLNFYLLAIAVLVSGYVSALNSRNHSLAVVVSLIAAAVTIFIYVIGARQDHVARLALSPIQELEDRLADALDIDSIRLIEQYRVRQELSTYAVRGLARFVVPVIIAVCLAAAIYAGVG